MQTFEDINVCEHLDSMRAMAEIWQDVLDIPSTETDDDHDDDDEPETSINTEDIDVTAPETIEMSGNFNAETGKWCFGGLSTHHPSSEDSTKLRRALMQRHGVALGESSWTADGLLVGYTLYPNIPDRCRPSCDCEGETITTVFETDFTTKVYARHAPLQAQVYRASVICSCGTSMTVKYNGDDDCLHFLSLQTAVGDEIGYDFIHR
jgi:hypothetical protein